MSEGSLVLYSTTGRRLQFDEREVKMPIERFEAIAPGKVLRHNSAATATTGSPSEAKKQGEDEGEEDGGATWFTKQWDAMKGFYMSRLWKDESLQNLSLEDFINRIADAVIHRWENQKAKQKEAKKRKRQREHEAAVNENERQKATRPEQLNGIRSNIAIITNFITLEDFVALDLMRRGQLVEAIGAAVATSTKGVPLLSAELLVDEAAPAPPASDPGNSSSSLDDRIAIRITFGSVESAHHATAQLNGQPAPTTLRPLLMELIPNEAPAEEQPKEFMDMVAEEVNALDSK